jgi:[ribosomal protein S5]-alanine N-acetyltransferase
MNRLEAPRLVLVPATAELVRMEISDRAALGRALGAAVPDNWPPELLADALPWFADQLEADPVKVGWLCWYGVLRGEGDDPAALAASGGFTGPPTEGSVEMGYSVLPQFQGRGLATEMAAALVAWALSHPDVSRVVAEVSAQNTPSLRLLRRIGFVERGPGREVGHLRFEREAKGLQG